MNNIIFSVNLHETEKPGRNDSYVFSSLAWKAYAKRHGCIYYELTERIAPEEAMNANWHKVFALSVLKNSGVDYNKVLIVDGDTIPNSNAPNIFDVCTVSGIHAVHNMGNYDWVIRSMENYSHDMFNGYMFDLNDYINTGVVVVDDTCFDFFENVQNFYIDKQDQIKATQQKYGTGTDQPVMNFMIHLNKIPLHILPFEWNMQELPRLEILDTELTFTKFGYVYHFNGISPDYPSPVQNVGTSNPVYMWMEYVYHKLYGSKNIC